MAKDYYELLGVERTASADEIKRAYRKLAHEHHPDKSGGDEEKFKQVNEANQILSKDEKRQQYDQFGANFDQGAGGFDSSQWAKTAGQGFGGFRAEGDIGDIFGDFFGFGNNRRGGQQTRGGDVQLDVTVDFTEAAFGKKETVELYKDDKCPRCNGNQAEPGTKLETCYTCKGEGVEQTVQQTILGAVRSSRTCSTCKGTGTIPDKPCKECKGQGITKQTKNLKIEIPAGIADGQTIRLTGQGEIGQTGTSPGDLYIKVHVKDDDRFNRDGDDILSEASISFSQAALGTSISVETLDGEVTLKVPAGTQSGKIFKLTNKGIARLQSGGRGDHLVTIIVKTPSKLSRKAKGIFRDLAEEE